MANYQAAFSSRDLADQIIADLERSNYGEVLTDTNDRSNIDPNYRITLDVKEALNKYRELKAEIVKLTDQRKELEKKISAVTPFLDEIRRQNTFLYDYGISTETSVKFMEYEKALKTELLKKHREMVDEASELLEKSQTLQKAVAEITQFIKEGVKGEVSEEEIHRLRDPNLCAICVENKVTHVFNPCGHTVCTMCIDPSLTRCHLCRKQIMTKIKIFFS